MPHSLALFIALLMSIFPHANAATPAEVAAALKTEGEMMLPQRLLAPLPMEDGSITPSGTILWGWSKVVPVCEPYIGPVQYFLHQTTDGQVSLFTVSVAIPNTSKHPTPGDEFMLLIFIDQGPNNILELVMSDKGDDFTDRDPEAVANTYSHLLSCYPLATSRKAKKRR